MSESLDELNASVRNAAAWVTRLREVVGKVVVGQQYLIDRLLVGLLANGHVLLEGVPGLAKTLAVRTLAAAIHATFQPHPVHARPAARGHHRHAHLQSRRRAVSRHARARSSRTSCSPMKSTARPRKCRARCSKRCRSGRSRSAARRIRCPSPFLVLATQNPIDQEGTYPLPEAQVDRFMLKVLVGYPSFEEERRILDTMAFTRPNLDVERVIELDDILATRKVVDSIHVDEKVRDYIVHVVFATRDPQKYQLGLRPLIQFGASPRATINLTLAAKAWALLQGRSYVTPAT